jgi:hypothetical protein
MAIVILSNSSGNGCTVYRSPLVTLVVKQALSIDYRCDNKRFWLSAHDCQVSTPTSQNLEVEQQIRISGAD